MSFLGEKVPPSLRGAIHRAADHAAQGLGSGRSARPSGAEALRRSLEPLIDGYRYSAVGVAGVFDYDGCQPVASVLGQAVVERDGLTTTIARVTRRDVLHDAPDAPGAPDWRRTPQPRSLNVWPSARAEPERRYRVDPLELLHWLRASSECTIVTFDNLADVMNRLALAKRLDGLVVVNSGRRSDLELMSSAIEILERKGVRILGQVRSLKEADATAGRPSGHAGPAGPDPAGRSDAALG